MYPKNGIFLYLNIPNFHIKMIFKYTMQRFRVANNTSCGHYVVNLQSCRQSADCGTGAPYQSGQVIISASFRS